MAIKSFGTTISFNSSAVAEVRDISVSESDTAEIDITTHDDEEGGWRYFLGGLKDGGTVTVSGLHSATNPLNDDADDGTAKGVLISFPGGGSVSFNGVLKGYGISLGLDNAVEFTATIKVSGPVTYA